jgi:hypothetical protein
VLKSNDRGEVKWVVPDVFFEQLPGVMKLVPPLPGEEALYGWIGPVFEAAAKDPEIKKALVESFVAADKELIAPLFQWRYNGSPAGNGWNSPKNNAQWGSDYLNRAGTAKSNTYDNKPDETKYIDTDYDADGQQLHSRKLYAITFPKGQTPRASGQRVSPVRAERAEPVLARHEEQDAQIQPGRLAHAVCRRKVPWHGQGVQLAARARWDFLLVYPGLLAGESHPRWRLAAAESRGREVTKPIKSS